MKNIFIIALLLSSTFACTNQPKNNETEQATEQKIGVLLVNHGSHSPTWRQALLDLETTVKDSIMANAAIAEIKTAFMEYTEPSIATRMQEFDKAGFTDVIIVPIFLTVSSHSFDDIPTIVGLKEDPTSLEHLKIEKIKTYKAKANIHITPLLDFTDILEKNVLSRVNSLSENAENEGLVLIAYGDEGYNTEWSNLMDTVGTFVGNHTGINAYSYGWCGHLVHYEPSKTTDAINTVLQEKETAIVVPILVAHDEMFQIQIIGDGIKAVANNNERVKYKPDSILPDSNVSQWVIDVVQATLHKI